MQHDERNRLDCQTANASCLFPRAATAQSGKKHEDIIITTVTADKATRFSEKPELLDLSTTGQKPKVQAVLTHGVFGYAVAARGEPSDDYVSALDSLLMVLAVAFERYSTNLVKPAETPVQIEGGMIDEALTKAKSWYMP